MEPKLIDAEAFEELWRLTDNPSAMRAYLDKRGLIAPEPVDPLEAEAERLIGETYAYVGMGAIDLALAALKRGMELQREAQPALTWRHVQNAVFEGYNVWLEPSQAEAIHAALTQPPHVGEGVGHG